MTDRTRITIRLRSTEEREALEAAAEGEPLATWVRRTLLTAAGRKDLVPESAASEAGRALRMLGAPWTGEGEGDG